jgi:hypothetical protein
MPIDWGHLGFMISFLAVTVGVAIMVLLFVALHLSRPAVFDKRFLREPHFTSYEIFHGQNGGVISYLLTQLVCLMIVFPKRKNFAWRKLESMALQIPLWYRCLCIVYLFWLALMILLSFGPLLVFQLHEYSQGVQ